MLPFCSYCSRVRVWDDSSHCALTYCGVSDVFLLTTCCRHSVHKFGLLHYPSDHMFGPICVCDDFSYCTLTYAVGCVFVCRQTTCWCHFSWQVSSHAGPCCCCLCVHTYNATQVSVIQRSRCANNPQLVGQVSFCAAAPLPVLLTSMCL